MVKNLRYKGFSNRVIPMHFDANEGATGLEKAVEDICRQAEEAVDENNNYIILTDRDISEDKGSHPLSDGCICGAPPPDQYAGRGCRSIL